MLEKSTLHSFMGKHHIHHFYGGFARKGIDTLKALRELPLSEIISICGEMNMPRPAIDRLLEKSGIRKKKGVKNTLPMKISPQSKKNIVRKDNDCKVQKQSVAKDRAGKTKTEASSYYHFASTPADQAEKFQPKKITPTEASSKQFNSAAGASKWNPGNTFEDRDYTKQANEMWSTMMKNFRWPGSALRLVAFPKLAMDFSIVCTRNKIKYLYDMAFTAKWKGRVGGEKVSGKLEMSDIMPDDDPDSWEWSISTSKNDAAHQSAGHIVNSSRDIITDNLKKLISQIMEKGSNGVGAAAESRI